jgi:hypothetical protein
MPDTTGKGNRKKSPARGEKRPLIHGSEQGMDAGTKWYCAREGNETRQEGRRDVVAPS